MKRSLLTTLTALIYGTGVAFGGSEAFEIGASNTSELPVGKEADGIIGDFVLRNDEVVTTISGNLPLRRANMGAFYGAGGVTPGCLYDAALRAAQNDQLTIFAPAGQRGRVSYVRVAETDSDDSAAIETVITSPSNDGLAVAHRYEIQDGWNGILITTTYENRSSDSKTVTTRDTWTQFDQTGSFDGVTWASSIDPADKMGYAYDRVEPSGDELPEDVELAPGQSLEFSRFLGVGNSPLAAYKEVIKWRGEAKTYAGRIIERGGAPVLDARIALTRGDETIHGFVDEEGRFDFALPQGEYSAVISSTGRSDITETFNVGEEGLRRYFTMGHPAKIAFNITDASGASIPCKVHFKGLDETPQPYLGPRHRAHGCFDQYHSEKGAFEVTLPPGKYEVTAVHGIEYSHSKQVIELAPQSTEEFTATLERIVDTTGWISADFHNHSTPSGDNVCGTDDRIINLAAEHIEFAPTTEHNRVYDWTPHIEKLGLSKNISTVVGIELTGSGTHFNSFPFEMEPFTQDNGAPVWSPDARITAALLENHQGARTDRWIHVNHPDMAANFIDRDGDGRPDGGFDGLDEMIDAIETQNYRDSKILATAPYEIIKGAGSTPFERAQGERFNYIREFIWLQMLNLGQQTWGIAVSDAHTVYGNGVGGWRTYIQSSEDAPEALDWEELTRNSKGGRMTLSTGPFLEVSTIDGIGPGGYARALDSVKLNVKVQCTDWIDIDRVQVLVNGRQNPDLNFTRESHPEWFSDGVIKFFRQIDVPLSQDSHLIVVAYGEDFDLSTGYGTSDQASIHPCAYNNPIFVDADGGGFEPNGDTLGYSLPVRNLTIDQVRAIMNR